jgi:hypothetical protein
MSTVSATTLRQFFATRIDFVLFKNLSTRLLIFNFFQLIVIYYTRGLNECLTSDAFNSASGEAASALTSQVKHSFSPRV